MEEKKKNEESKLREINGASTRGNWNTGTGLGPDDCMSLEVFNQLNMNGAISGTIYVCGLGYINAGVGMSGSGCSCGYSGCSCSSSGGSGSGGSGCGCGCGHYGSGVIPWTGKGKGPGDCMSQELFEALDNKRIVTEITYVCGWGWTIPTIICTGSGSGSASGSASGCGCGCGCGSGSASGCGCGSSSGCGCGCGSNDVNLMDRSKFVPFLDGDNCYTNCEKILRSYGITYPGSCTNAIRLVYESQSSGLSYWGNYPDLTYINATRCIDRHLNAGRVMIVGVDHTPGQTINERATDHFVVITGKGYDSEKQQYFYSYMETGTSKPETGCSESNRFYYKPGPLFEEIDNDGKKYVVTQIRPNDGGADNTTSTCSEGIRP